MDDVEKYFVERRSWLREIMEEFIGEALLLSAAQPREDAPPVEVVNLSEAGAGVLISARLEKGTPVSLQICGENIPRLDFEAEVRWSAESPVSTGKYPMGLKFRPLEEGSLSKLRDFIEILRTHRPPSE